MPRALVPILAALLGLAGSLAATLFLHRSASGTLERVLEERLRGTGETAVLSLSGKLSDASLLRALMEANALDGALVLDRSLVILADATGPAGRRVDLLRVDASRVARAFAGQASVAPGYSMDDLRIVTGHFPIRAPDGTVTSVLVLEAGESFGSARAALGRALALGVVLSVAGALALALAAAQWVRGERLRREAAARAARGDTLARVAAVAAHEIRTPLGVIRATIELMRERIGASLAARDRSALADVLAEVERLRQLTEDLLDLAADRPLALATVDLGELLAEAARGFGAVQPGVTLRIDAPGPMRVKGDPGRLRQVFANLLANAAHAGARSIEVSGNAGPEEVRLVIRDDGPGIAPDVRERLFEPFASGRAGGTGLGLALSRRLVQRHGGALSLAEGSGPGAAFEMRLPVLQG